MVYNEARAHDVAKGISRFGGDGVKRRSLRFIVNDASGTLTMHGDVRPASETHQGRGQNCL